MQPFIHETAVVDEGAIIGEGTKVWHFSHISGSAIIGRNCTIGQNCFIDENVVIGNGVKIQNNVSVYKGVILEDDVFIGPSVVFTNVRKPRSAHPASPDRFMATVIKRGASIGANSTILCGITLEEGVMIGIGCVVTDSLPKGITMVASKAGVLIPRPDGTHEVVSVRDFLAKTPK